MYSDFNNEIKENKPFMDIIRDSVSDRLDEMEGMTVVGADMASEVTMPDNMDGCFVIYTDAAKDFISHYFNEAGETFEYFKSVYGNDWNENPFEDPSKFTFFMEEYGVETLLNDIPVINDNWDEDIELTPEIIAQIKHEIGMPGYENPVKADSKEMSI